MNKKCLGCGTYLQNDNIDKDGYTTDITKSHCERCFRLTNYGEYKITSRSNSDYIKILNSINNKELVVYVSSILNLNLDYLNKFKNIILVITKRDIIPKSVKDNNIKKYIKDRYSNINDIIIVSSINNYNLDQLYNSIVSSGYKKVYFVGNTNSGKSTLINKIIKNYSDKEVVITTSIYPSTTLDVIDIKLGEITIIDTPGIVNLGSITNYIDNKILKKISPKKEIKPRTYQIKGEGSLVIEDLVRIDYQIISGSMTIYIANNVSIVRVGNTNERLLNLDKRKIIINDNKDLVIEDLCFIKFTNKCKLNVYCNKCLHIYSRDNLI